MSDKIIKIIKKLKIKTLTCLGFKCVREVDNTQPNK